MTHKSVFKASVNAAKWGYLGAALKIVAQLLAQVLIARQLGPDQFGIFAIAAIVIGLANFFSDLGMSLVQKREVNETDIRHVFTVQFLIGSVTTSTVLLLAHPLANLLNDTRSGPVIEALSFVLFLHAASAVSTNLLRRNLDFRSIQIAQISSYVVGFLIVGVALAFSGAGVWALVFAWITQSITNLALQYNKTRHSLRFLFNAKGQSESNRFNAMALLTNMTNWAVANAPKIFISKLFATQAVGVYSITYNLLMAPLHHVLSTLQQVLFSSSSKLQHDEAILGKTFLSLAGCISFVAFPVFIGMALMAGDITLALFGKAWLGTADVFVPMSLVMPLLLLMGCATPIVWGMGKVNRELFAQGVTAIVLIAAMSYMASSGFLALVWTVSSVLVARTLLMTTLACGLMQIRMARLFRSLLPATLATIVVIAGVGLASHGMHEHDVNIAVRLAINTAIIFFVLVAFLRAHSLFGHEANLLLSRLSAELPAPLRPLINRPKATR